MDSAEQQKSHPRRAQPPTTKGQLGSTDANFQGFGDTNQRLFIEEKSNDFQGLYDFRLKSRVISISEPPVV